MGVWTEPGIWAIAKTALNNLIGQKFILPLDRLLAAKIAIRGYPGMEFHLRNDDTGQEFDITLNEKDKIASKGQYTFSQRIIPVEFGTWGVTIRPFNGGDEANVVINVNDIGICYPLSYNTLVEVAEITESGYYAFSQDYAYIDASGGGGAGGGGGGGGSGGRIFGTNSKFKSGGGGGGGGGRGDNGKSCNIYLLFAYKKKIYITIGNGGESGVGGNGGEGVSNPNGDYPGKSGKSGESGTSGGATIIGDFMTLAGGVGGTGGDFGRGGNVNDEMAAAGGLGGILDGENGSRGEVSTSGGKGGKGGKSASSRFGIGGDGGDGGDGGSGILSNATTQSFTDSGKNGTNGKNGNQGYVKIYSGLYIPR